ncbi:hypothetical protein LEMLEM_LOCUS1593, partial [Lemmus lemmus]
MGGRIFSVCRRNLEGILPHSHFTAWKIGMPPTVAAEEKMSLSLTTGYASKLTEWRLAAGTTDDSESMSLGESDLEMKILIFYCTSCVCVCVCVCVC